jgi:hypothetical protein
MRNPVLVMLVVMLLVLTACGGPAAPAQNKTNETVKEAAPVEETTPQNVTNNTVEKPVETHVVLNEKPTGAMVAALKIKNGDALPNLRSLNVSFRRVELEIGNKTGSWVPVVTTKTYPNVKTLGDDSFELGLNSVPAQAYKSIRLQLSSSGDGWTGDKLVSYSLPYEYLQIVKPFTVTQDSTLLFIFEMDLAKSATDANGTIIVKPSGVATLLDGAQITRKGDGRLSFTGGTEVYSIPLTFEQLLPPGTLAKVVSDCKKKCPDSCSTQSDSCASTCMNEVAKGCSMGGTDCRDHCDPVVFPVYCRDACALSSSECTANLIDYCKTGCAEQNTEPCIARCESACAS